MKLKKTLQYNYMSSTSMAFCHELDISHILTSVDHHWSNPAVCAIKQSSRSYTSAWKQATHGWHLGLLKYLCTPILDSILSSSELLNHRYQGVQHFLHLTTNSNTASFILQEKIQDEKQKHQELNKLDYNKSSVVHHNEIIEDSNVLVHITDQKTNCQCKGIVLHHKDKIYNIQLENSKVINCNRVDV